MNLDFCNTVLRSLAAGVGRAGKRHGKKVGRKKAGWKRLAGKGIEKSELKKTSRKRWVALR
jgi:hypothetical protein